MLRNYQKRDVRVKHDIAQMAEAINAVRRGYTLRAAAERYEVPFGTLCKHYNKEGEVKVGGGRKPELSEKEENDIFYGPVKLIGNGQFQLKRADYIKIKSAYNAKEKEFSKGV